MVLSYHAAGYALIADCSKKTISDDQTYASLGDLQTEREYERHSSVYVELLIQYPPPQGYQFNNFNLYVIAAGNILRRFAIFTA